MADEITRIERLENGDVKPTRGAERNRFGGRDVAIAVVYEQPGEKVEATFDKPDFERITPMPNGDRIAIIHPKGTQN